MPKRYLPECCERAVRMISDHGEDYGSTTAACKAVSSQHLAAGVNDGRQLNL
jgi:hypothetical protein